MSDRAINAGAQMLGNLVPINGAQSDMRNALNQWQDRTQGAQFAQIAQVLKPSPLDDTLAYFRREGLTNEQIRKAITPALFKMLAEQS